MIHDYGPLPFQESQIMLWCAYNALKYGKESPFYGIKSWEEARKIFDKLRAERGKATDLAEVPF